MPVSQSAPAAKGRRLKYPASSSTELKPAHTTAGANSIRTPNFSASSARNPSMDKSKSRMRRAVIMIFPSLLSPRRPSSAGSGS